MSTSTINKNDGRAKNGGKRPNCGRPTGKTPTTNKAVRFPLELIDQAEALGIKRGQYTKLIVAGFKKELNNLAKSKAKTKK